MNDQRRLEVMAPQGEPITDSPEGGTMATGQTVRVAVMGDLHFDGAVKGELRSLFISGAGERRHMVALIGASIALNLSRIPFEATLQELAT